METMLVMTGITNTLQASAPQLLAYPTVGTDAAAADLGQVDTEADWRKCAGCRHRRSYDDPEHSRIPGECRVPLIQPVVYDCPGCIGRKHRSDEAHTYEAGECRWATAQSRASAPRLGHHPRLGRVRARDHPTRDLPGDTLGIADEDAAVAAVPSGTAAAAASSSDPHGSAEPRRTRGPDLVPRAERTTHADTASGPDHVPSWQGFDVHKSIVGLMTGTTAACKRILQRRHMR